MQFTCYGKVSMPLSINFKVAVVKPKIKQCIGRHMRYVQKVSSRALGKIETLTEEDTRFKKHCTWDNDTSVPFKDGTLGPHTLLPGSLPLFKTLCKILCWNHRMNFATTRFMPRSCVKILDTHYLNPQISF